MYQWMYFYWKAVWLDWRKREAICSHCCPVGVYDCGGNPEHLASVEHHGRIQQLSPGGAGRVGQGPDPKK